MPLAVFALVAWSGQRLLSKIALTALMAVIVLGERPGRLLGAILLATAG